MQDTISLNLTPLQAILGLAFQIWIVVFPIMIMQKIDRLTNLLEDRFGDQEPADSGEDADDRNGEA